MDPNQPQATPNPPPASNPPDPHGADQAAQLIRRQVQQLYDQQGAPPQQQPTYQPFHPAQAVAQPHQTPDQEQPQQPHQPLQPLPAKPMTEPQSPFQSAQPQYRQPAATPQAASPYQPNKYGTFAIPGHQQAQEALAQPQAVQPQPQAAQPTQHAPEPLPGAAPIPQQSAKQDKSTIADLKSQILARVSSSDSSTKHSRAKPFAVALAVAIIFLGVSYNEIAVAQIRKYVSPGSTVSTPIILDPSEDVKVGKESRVIIPKINVDVPVVYDIKSYDESEIQAGLERGVVHYGETAVPGEQGNNVIVGHSSNNFFNSGKYKFAFVLLDRLDIGDTFILNYRGTRYIYRITNKEVIEPTDFRLIQPTNTPTTTLITCTPPGTSWKRLVIQGEQISPSPDSVKKVKTSAPDSTEIKVPGNAPSFWQNIRDAIF